MAPRRKGGRTEASTESFDTLVALYQEIVLQIRNSSTLQRTIATLGLTEREYADRWVIRHGGKPHGLDVARQLDDGRLVLDEVGVNRTIDAAYELASNPHG